MTRDEAAIVLTEAGEAGDDGFPLLEAAIACAIHDYPFRDPEPVRMLAGNIARRLSERVGGESPDDALSETLSADLRLNGDLLLTQFRKGLRKDLRTAGRLYEAAIDANPPMPSSTALLTPPCSRL